MYILSILVIGISGLVAQALILRELLISFQGNELTLGIIIANWVIVEAMGVFVLGKYIDRVKADKMNIFVALEIFFSLALFLVIYLSRVFKNISGIPFGEVIGLGKILSVSFLIVLPVGSCHGALFSLACKIYSLRKEDNARSIGKVYAWETIGNIFGGIILTYLFIPKLNSFQIAFIVFLANMTVCLIFFKNISARFYKYIIVFTSVLLLYIYLIGGLSYIQKSSVNKQWVGQKILDYRNSVYGNITVTEKENQQTFFYNGVPLISTPYPNTVFVEELGNLPLLFHGMPKDVLVIGGGAGGLINEIQKHNIDRLDYAELDPLIIDMVKAHPSRITKKELSDKRVNVVNLDGRFFIRSTDRKYDIILIGISNPSDLSTNRLFTQEFFVLAKRQLNKKGILAFYLPGSLTYLSQELRDLNSCIFNSLKHAYDCVRIIPGDYNIFLASDSYDLAGVDAILVNQRIAAQNLKTNILIPSYINYRLDKKWVVWLAQSLKSSSAKPNRDFMPQAMFAMLIIWNKQFSPFVANILVSFKSLTLLSLSLFILLITLVIFYVSGRRHNLAKMSIAYSIATTGFLGMLINLILIFSFQVLYGYIYHKIGILISILMTGVALGGIFMSNIISRVRRGLNLLIKIEFMAMLFCYAVALIITGSSYLSGYPALIFIPLFLLTGILIGLEFPLASKIYLDKKSAVGETVGTLYCLDLVGGWIAGILTGIVFLPVLGLFNTCMIALFFKLSSLIILMVAKRDAKFSLTQTLF